MTLCHNETLDWVNSATDAPRNGGINALAAPSSANSTGWGS